MRRVMFVSTFLFFLLLCGQVLLSADNAYAKCCGCGTCTMYWFCSCPGEDGCSWYPCSTDDPDTFRAYVPAGNEMVDIRASRTLGMADRLTHLTKVGECARRNFAGRILGEAGDGLKVESFGLGERNHYDKIVALRVAVNAEQ